MRVTVASALVWASFASTGLTAGLSSSIANSVTDSQAVALNLFSTAQNATKIDISAAQLIVKNAVEKMAKLNKARLDHPLRTIHTLKSRRRSSTKRDIAVPPLLTISKEVSHAAALLATLEGDPTAGSTKVKPQKRANEWWMANVGHKGSVPWGNDTTYKVYRNVVTDYGADNTGSKDATAAIQKAISDGKRCGAKCNGSTVKNAIVYFPPGRYLVSSSIAVYFGTQIIGDALNPPTIVAAKSYVGLGVLSTDVYVDNGGTGPDGNALEWYINTARFYSQIRNIKIDIRATPANAYVAALHYQVAQATTLENVELIADSSTTQQGIFAENGSGGVMSDVTFTGGAFGIYGGSQQFSANRLLFNGCNTAVQLIWDWGWVWKTITVKNGKVGFRLYNDQNNEIPGSVTIVDSNFMNLSSSSIEMAVPKDTVDTGFTGLVLDNVYLGSKVKDYQSTTALMQPGYYKTFVIGSTYKNNKRSWYTGPFDYTRNATLQASQTADNLQVVPYFERQRNQYLNKSPGDFVHLKDLGAKGDGSTDDTSAIQAALNKYADGSKIIYVDAGTYIVTNTITIPKDAKLVGETWSQIAANGYRFMDAKRPIPMLKIGNSGETGTVELQDLILTSKGPTPGLICMQWNVAASSKGSAALWDVHVRLGGASGTGLLPSNCPPSTTKDNGVQCQVASMLLHVTKQASGYFDNMWLWVADHMIDDPLMDDANNNMDQLSVYSARGMLIESQAPTWLYGTSSEHSVLYQYNFFGAQNIFTTMIQTESPYYQPTPKPPSPFDSFVGVFSGDPTYTCKGNDADGCDESWAVMMKNSQNIHISAAGTYSWFSNYTQACVDPHTCQKALWLIDSNYNNNRIQNIIGIGAKNILVTPDASALISAKDNLAVSKHPSWAHISVYEVPSSGYAPGTEPPPPPPPVPTCSKDDRMYDSVDMGKAIIDLWSHDGTKMETTSGADDMTQFVTIVNLTPYKMVWYTEKQPYQFTTWDFGDVPSGKSRKNEVKYDNGNGKSVVDCNGYANYRLEGTDKKFFVKVTTHVPDDYERRVIFDLGGMGGGWRELGFQGEAGSVALIITGSESYGYVNSLQLNNAAWMKTMYDVIKDRELRHVVIPGAHDAGVSKISSPGSGWTGGGIPANTETQSLDHYNQLVVGTRYFDMRIASVKGGDFWAAHVDDEKKGAPFGATGESLNDLIAGVNRFTTDYPGEVIIWYIKYMVDFDNGKTDSSARYWSPGKINEFYTKLEGINNRCVGLNTSAKSYFETMPVKTFMDMNNGKGCVLLITDGTLSSPQFPRDRVSSGIYNSTMLRRDDFWGEEQWTAQNAPKVLNKMKTHARDAGRPQENGPNDDTFFILQWQCTPNAANMQNPPTIQLIANQETNPALYYYGVNEISPEAFPTVILHDAVGLFHAYDLDSANYNPMMQTLAIGLNLYMVSQNCAVSKARHPFIKSKSSRQARSDQRSGFDTFTGVIFANGTRLETRPADFCETCTYGNTGPIDHPVRKHD